MALERDQDFFLPIKNQMATAIPSTTKTFQKATGQYDIHDAELRQPASSSSKDRVDFGTARVRSATSPVPPKFRRVHTVRGSIPIRSTRKLSISSSRPPPRARKPRRVRFTLPDDNTSPVRAKFPPIPRPPTPFRQPSFSSADSRSYAHQSHSQTQHLSSRGAIPVHPDTGILPEIHHFDSCLHTSPPNNRPLDAQPHLTPNPAYNPSTLPFSLFTSSYPILLPPQFISTIPGPCFACDTLRRRQAEAEITGTYKPLIQKQGAQAAELRRTLQSAEDRTTQTATTGDRGIQDLRALAEYLEVEAEAETEALVAQEDREVKRVWNGYSARWGPGTIGRGKEGRMRVEWIRPEREELGRERRGAGAWRA